MAVEEPSSPHNPDTLPVVEDGVLLSLELEGIMHADASAARFHDLNETNHSLAQEIILEATRRAMGNISKQEAFVEGASFLYEALRRQLEKRSWPPRTV